MLCALLLAAACRKEEPPAPTEQQSAQLNEAEDMLDAQSAKEKGPETNAPGPSNSSD